MKAWLNGTAAFQTLLGLGASRTPTTYATITGAKNRPIITYTPSQKVAGERRKRKTFTPATPKAAVSATETPSAPAHNM